ncbi:MAG: LamG-like jellyroll fold domain-containing protein [bacterium]
MNAKMSTGAGRALWSIVVGGMLLAGNVAQGGLVAHWRFNEGTGTTVSDSSGVGNHASAYNGMGWATGFKQQCGSFDGNDDYVRANAPIPQLFRGYGDGSFTVSFWMRYELQPTRTRVLTMGSVGDLFSSTLDCVIEQTGQLAGWMLISIKGVGGSLCLPVQNLVGKWALVTVRYDAKAQTLYAQLNDSTSVSFAKFPSAFVKGDVNLAQKQGTESNFKGLLDEVKIYSHALTDAEINAEYRQLVAHWRMDEDGGATVTDSTGNGCNGTLMNGPTRAAGKRGNAMRFDGVNDYVDCGNSDLLKPTANITIAMWVKPAATQKTYADLFGGHANNQGYVIQQNLIMTNQFLFAYNNGSGWQCGPVLTQLKAGQWNFFVVQKDGNKVRHYLDGKLTGEADVTGDIYYLAGERIYIGEGYIPGQRNFNGLIDEVKVYNYALTANDISKAYSNDYNGLVAHWRMDEGGGAIVADSAGNGNNGTLLGAAAWGAGKCGGAVQFDGIDDYVDCGNSALLKPTKNITISMWVKPAAIQKTYADLFGGHANNQGYVIQQHLIMTNEFLFVYNNGSGWQGGNVLTQLKAGQWNFFVVQKDGNKVRHYLDGKLTGETDVTGDIYYLAGERIYIGEGYIPGQRNFNGLIDEVKMFDRALSADEIWNEYKGLVLRYKFDEGDAKMALDSSVNRLNGDIAGAVPAQGKIRKGLSFDGTDDYVQAPGPADLNGPATITIRASGSYCNGWPLMQLFIDGQMVKQWEVNSTAWLNYSWYGPAQATISDHQIDIVFPNDAYQAPADRNLYVDYVQFKNKTLQANDALVTFDRGAPFDGIDVLAGTKYLYWSGALRFKAPDDWLGCSSSSFSVSFWMKCTPAQKAMRILDIGNRSKPTDSSAEWSVGQNGYLQLRFPLTSPIATVCDLAAYAGQWVFVATTYDGANRLITYANGNVVLDSWVVPVKGVRPRDFLIGQGIGAESYFKGAVDEVSIYNRALSAQEVLTDYKYRGAFPRSYQAYEDTLDRYAKSNVRYFTSDQANNLPVGFPHAFYGTGKFRVYKNGSWVPEAWDLTRGYGSHVNINEVTLRFLSLAAAYKMNWLTSLPENQQYAQSWGSIVTGLRTLERMQNAGNAMQFTQGTFHRTYLTAIHRLPYYDLDRTAAEITRDPYSDEQSSDDNGLPYANLLLLEGLANDPAVSIPDRTTIVSLCQLIRSKINLKRFVINNKIVMNYINGSPGGYAWDRESTEGSVILAALLTSGQIRMSEFYTLASSLKSYPVTWNSVPYGTISVDKPSYNAAMYAHGARSMHGLPVTEEEFPNTDYFRTSVRPVAEAHIDFALHYNLKTLGSEAMTQTLLGQPVFMRNWANVRFPGNEGNVMPVLNYTTAKATGPHAWFVPLSRWRYLAQPDIDSLFSWMADYEAAGFLRDFGWDAAIPLSPTDTVNSWVASDGTRKYTDWGRPYEALNAAYTILHIFDALNPDAPLASYNVEAVRMGHIAAYFDKGVPLPSGLFLP